MSDHTHETTGGPENGVSLPDTVTNSAAPDTTSNYSSAREGNNSGSSSGNGGYFAQHGITAGPKEDFASMFNRLAIQEGWSKKQRNKHRPEAIAGEFKAFYGTNTEKLNKWQELCRDVGIEPEPSIKKCKKALSKVYVNLVNLIDHRRNRDVPLRVFPNYHAFRTWTLGGKNGRSRIFPKEAAKEEGFIKALLRDLQLH